jgi:hypothetical protein
MNPAFRKAASSAVTISVDARDEHQANTPGTEDDNTLSFLCQSYYITERILARTSW